MSVKMKYNLLFFLYCMTGCCLGGFVAVFLQYKNVSNTLIGVVTGTGCVTAIFLTPYVSNLIKNIKGMNVTKMTNWIYIILAVVYTLLVFLPLPPMVIMVIFTLIYALYLSSGPLLQMLASDYMQIGEEVNFGLARGLGSTAWAVTALVFGFLVEKFNPSILAIGFVLFTTMTLLLMNTMPKVQPLKSSNKKDGSISQIIKKYPIFWLLLIGFSLMLAAATSISTYLINIVTKLGGDTSFFGIAVFLMAFSELPVMAITPRLMRRFKSVQLITVAAFSYLIRNVLICVAPNLFVLCLGMMFQGLSFGLLTAVITYYVIYNLDVADQMMGQTMIIMMTSGFGAMIGNFLGGILQDNFGLNVMYIFVIVMTIIGASCIILAKIKTSKPQYKSEIKR